MEIYSLTQLLQDNAVAPTPLIDDGILLKQSLLLITGAKKARKTFLAYNFGVALAAGVNFAGFKIINKHKVLIFSAEGGYYPNRDRIQTMCEGIDEESKKNLFVCFDSRVKIEDDENFDQLVEKIIEIEPEVVIIDPFVKFHHLDENSATDMGRILERLRCLIEDYNLAIILVHHLGKDISNGARGSSAILGEYDACITLMREGGEDKLRHRIEFDLRHSISPDPRNINFDSAHLFFFEAISPIVEILQEKGTTSRKDLVEAMITKGLFQHQSGAYKAIDREIKNGSIIVNGEDKLEISTEQ